MRAEQYSSGDNEPRCKAAPNAAFCSLSFLYLQGGPMFVVWRGVSEGNVTLVLLKTELER
jgi:hypothetical protein